MIQMLMIQKYTSGLKKFLMLKFSLISSQLFIKWYTIVIIIVIKKNIYMIWKRKIS